MSSVNPLSIDYLATLPERKRAEIITENTDISHPVHLSIIPAAHHFDVWPDANVFWRYLPEIFIVYPEFFHRADANWVEYGIGLADGRCMVEMLTPFYSAIQGLAFANPSRHGPAFLYAAKVLEKADDTVEWLGLHGKELYERYDIGAIGCLVYSHSQPVQLAVIKAARLTKYRFDVLEDMIGSVLIADKTFLTVLPLDEEEKSRLRSRLPKLSKHTQDLVKNFL